MWNDKALLSLQQPGWKKALVGKMCLNVGILDGIL